MKAKQFLAGALAMGMTTLAALAAPGNEPEARIEELQKQIKQLQENFERVVREQHQSIEQLQRQVQVLSGRTNDPTQLPRATMPAGQDLGAPTSAAGSGASSWSPAQPMQLQAGKSYLDVSLVGTFAAGASTAHDIEGGTQLGGHDPNQNGFTLQGVEANFQGMVDPYFRANANVVYTIDSAGKSGLELEEGWLETLSLPGKLQLRAGQILTEFGRQNPTHPHAWAFVDTPLVLGRFLGPDGLRNLGGRVSWLAPTPFYSEAFLTVQNSQGETAFSFRNDHDGGLFFGRPQLAGRAKSFSDLLITPRYAVSFDLTDNQTLLAGVSGAFGANASGADGYTQIYGADVYWKWKAPNSHGGYPFVAVQSEALLRRYKAVGYDGSDARQPLALPGETLTDYGLYAQALYGFREGWVAALRGDWVTSEQGRYEQIVGRDLERATRWRVSPNLTWYPSEFSKLRLQYNFDDRELMGTDHSVWLQWEFLLGAHAAHKF